MKTLYDVLEIDSAATQSEIEQGYHRLLDRYLAHQGTNKSSKETRRMQAIREAYLQLGSPQQRQAYDLGLKLGRHQQADSASFARSPLTRRLVRFLLILLVFATVAYVAGISRSKSIAATDQLSSDVSKSISPPPLSLTSPVSLPKSILEVSLLSFS